MIVEAQNIRVRRGDVVAVRDLSLVARPGAMLGLIGPNGAGKTSLLRALAALEPLAAGTLAYGGRSPAVIGRRAFGRTVAFLPQNGRIHWPLPVEEVVALGRLPHGPAQVDAAALRAMAAVDLTGLRHRAASTLSGGERARLLLARALAVEAQVLLVDEPVAALDPYHQLQVMEVLRAAARSGTTVVAVLHDLTLAARFCDRLALMKDGVLIAEGPSAQVLVPEQVVAAYDVTMAAGRFEGEPFILPWRRGGAAQPEQEEPQP